MRFPDSIIPIFGTTALAVLLASAPAMLQAQGKPERPGPSRTALTAAELAIWNDPRFQRAFAESYIAETEIEPRVTEEERTTMLEILDLISNDEMAEGTELLEEALESETPVSAVFDFTLANIYFQQDELDEAEQHYTSAVEKFPKFRRAHKNLALIRVRQTDYENAIDSLVRTIELGGNDATTYGLLGFSYSNLEQFLPAESAYRNAILLDPETLDWKLGLARAFFRQERFAEAVALTQSLLEQFPDRTDLWLLQANAYLGLERPMDAAEVYELVDALGGSTVDSLNMLGDIYINEELFQLASRAYIRAIDIDEADDPSRPIRAAQVLAARGAFEETKLLIARIKKDYAGNIADEARKNLLKLEARVAVAEGQADDEVRVLEEIVELDPLDGEALILLGQHANRTGDPERAVFYFERAGAIEGFEADARVRQAQVLVSQGDYQEALPLLRRAQQINYRENVQDYLEQVERVARN